MKMADEKIRDLCSRLRSIEMSPGEQEEIWSNIEQEIRNVRSPGRTYRHVRRIRGHIAIAMGAAFVVLLGTAWFHGISKFQVSKDRSQPAVAGRETSVTTFQAPTEIGGIMIADSTPGSLWYYPVVPGKVTHQVYKWLQSAVPTKVVIQQTADTIIMAGNVGPAQLFLTDQNGHRITIELAHYVKRQGIGQAIESVDIDDVISYQDGHNVTYLKSPELYAWLKQQQWKHEFEVVGYTEAELKAIQAVFNSTWGQVLRLFPREPGEVVRTITRGGSTPAHNKASSMMVTLTTQVQQVGANVRVTFIETWYNGEAQHIWTFVISPNGTILSHGESGAIPPQFPK